MITRIVDRCDHGVATNRSRSGGRTIISQIHTQTRRSSHRRSRLGSAIKCGCEITESDGGRSNRGGDGVTDHQRASGSFSVICIVNNRDNRVAANRSRSCERTIIGHVHGEACRNRGDRHWLRRGIMDGDQISKIDRGRCLINHQSTKSGSLVSGIVDGGHHRVTARIGGDDGGAIVGDSHAQAGRHRGDRDRLGATIVDRCQPTEGDWRGMLIECFGHTQSDRIDLNKLRCCGRDTPVLPTGAIAGIDHHLNAIDAGKPNAPSGQRQPCATGAHFRTSGPDACIEVGEKLQRDSTGS